MKRMEVPAPLLKNLFPDDVFTAQIVGEVRMGEVQAIEEALVARTAPKRQAEFTAGRACAHAAIRAGGFEPCFIGREANGAPSWPDHIVGSISHTSGFVCAAIASSARFLSLGIDAELVGAVTSELWPFVFTGQEQHYLATSEIDPLSQSSALFAAKEAFYKLQWPLTGEWLEFQDVDISVSDDLFTVRPARDRCWTKRLGVEVHGRVVRTQDVVLAGLAAV